MRRILLALLGALLILAGSTAIAASAQADPVTCTPHTLEATYTTTIAARVDSGMNGNWATDSFVRTTEVYDECDGGWVLHIFDSGHFTTHPGALSPMIGAPLPSPATTGKFTGSAVVKVKSETEPVDGTSAGAGGTVSTSEWFSLIFPDGSAELTYWQWFYVTKCEKWINSINGNSGDVTGKKCYHKPHPTSSTPAPTSQPTTSTPTSTTRTTASEPSSSSVSVPVVTNAAGPGGAGFGDGNGTTGQVRTAANGDLAYTGVNVGWAVGLGVVLLVGGAALLVVRRRRPRDQAADSSS